ncbi:MAG TPA: hypothetical protein VK804_05210 [Bradyrhizobium sp.]|jgi:hypothetical protein|nr:hypothetical protein [Bradyrhizobium sp.]
MAMNLYPFGAGHNALEEEAKPFLVTLARRRPPTPSPLTRGQVVERGVASSKAFFQHLMDYVDRTNRRYELVQIGDPSSFGIVSIVTTKELADEITRFPEVESVIEDTAPMILVR